MFAVAVQQGGGALQAGGELGNLTRGEQRGLTTRRVQQGVYSKRVSKGKRFRVQQGGPLIS